LQITLSFLKMYIFQVSSSVIFKHIFPIIANGMEKAIEIVKKVTLADCNFYKAPEKD